MSDPDFTESLVIRAVDATAVYRNVDGDCVIRQIDADGNDECVAIPTDRIDVLIEAILATRNESES